MLYKHFLISLIVFIYGAQLFGQDPAFINYNTKDGLPSSEVYDVEIDESGLLWFSTDRGVCSYDGYDFKTYTTGDGLADNTNFEIFKDSKKRLWYFGYSGNVSYYENGQFHGYEHNDSLINILNGYWIDHVAESNDSDNSLNIISHFNLTNSAIKISTNQLPQSILYEKLIENNNKITFGEYNLLPFGDKGLIFGPQLMINKKTSGMMYKMGSSVKSDDNWIQIKDNVINKRDKNGHIIQSIESDKNLSNQYIDRSNNLWVYSPNGVRLYPNCDLSAKSTLYFKGIQITSVIEDLEGNFWLTTLKKGIIFVPSFQIKSIRLPTGNENAFLSIGAMDNHIIFGGDNKNILCCNESNECFEKLIDTDLTAQVKSINPIHGNLFFNGHEAIEKNEEVFIKIIPHRDPNFGLELIGGEIILFTERGYIVKSKNEEETLTNTTLFENPFTPKMTKIVQSKNKDVWIGTLKGLFVHKNILLPTSPNPIYMSNNQSFGRVNDLLIQNDNLWVATVGNGLQHINTRFNNSSKIADGLLTSDLVNCIYIQNDTTLWVGTNKGVDIVNYKYQGDSISVKHVKSLTTRDGLISNFINDIEYWNQTIYLATSKGVCHFSPSIIEKSHEPVPIKINELIVNDSIYLPEDKLEFEHNQNDLFVHFTGLNFRKNKNKDFYKYRLTKDKEKTEWFYTNEKNIRYSNLAPANYLFEVNAQNNSSEWNQTSTQLSFIIHPHYAQTIWFRVISFLGFLGFLAFIYNVRVRRIKRQEEANRKLEQAQLRIREAELSALRNQMNPHFLYNSLNSIQNFIFKKDFEKANYYLVKFSRLMRNSLNFSRLDLIPLTKELTFLNNYIELETMRFPNKFNCNFIVEKNIPEDALMIPSLLLQPVLENAIKHAFKDIDYLGEMNVYFSTNANKQLKIIIEDNGPGFIIPAKNQATSEDIIHKSLGLEIIKNRINLINENNSTIESSMTFINKKDEAKNETGLKVVFLLPEIYQA